VPFGVLTTHSRIDPGAIMSAEDPGSVTRLLKGLKEGQPEAVEAIWNRYYQRVLAVARRRLRGGPHDAAEDDEDVALSALNGLAAGAAQGRFPRLDDRSDLWHVLAAITVRKAINRRRWYERRKRSGPRASGDQAATAGPHDHAESPDADSVLDRVVSKEPIPEAVALLQDQLENLLAALDDPVLRRIAEWRMEGASNAEIARKLGRARRTVERKIVRIRVIWEKIDDEAD
jgi:DNA-directed RNA polymerase specialized sigma24 family protein